MKTTGFVISRTLVMVLIASALVTPTSWADEDRSLAQILPNDVFLYVHERNNPEKDFLDLYWGEVLEALAQSGIHEDAIDLIGTIIGLTGGDGTDELIRIKERFTQLVAGVDWSGLEGKESVFSERFVPPAHFSDKNPPVMMPQMVIILRGTSEGAEANFKGLAAILDAMVEEINNAVGREVVTVDRMTRKGAAVAQIDILKRLPGAPSLPIAVCQRDDLVLIGIRDGLIDDVLALLDGSSEKKALADSPRFKAGFANLPPGENYFTFFDMQTMMKSLRATGDVLVRTLTAPRDVYTHSSMTADINGLAGKAMSAYESGDYEKALELIRKAHEIAPKNSVVLYNLACFNACAGNKAESLAWLEKAVEGGFHAPRKIGNDPDLATLHGEPGYAKALDRAAELALMVRARDMVLNESGEKEVHSLRIQIHQACEQKNYEQALKLAEQAYAIAPTDSRVLYNVGFLHALLGNEQKALDFLEKAVDGGFYCPNHIARDPDWASVRESERFQAALAKSRKYSAEVALGQTKSWAAMAFRIIDRVADNVAFLDYVAAIEATDGYTTTTESIAVLAPGAKDLPIYEIFGNRPPLTDFDRYLPQETVSFSISQGIDFVKLYEFILDTIRVVGPIGEEFLAKWEGLQKQIGIDIRKDVVGWIDGDAISMTFEDGNTVAFIKVTDEETAREKIAAAIDFSATKLSELVRQNPAMMALNMMRMRSTPVNDERLAGFQSLRFAMSPKPVIWGVKDGFVIFGTSVDAIVLSLATAAGDHPNIRSNERVMKEAIVPDGPFAALSLTDMRKLGEGLEEGFGIAAMVTGMMGAFIPEPKVQPVVTKISVILGKLAPVARKIDFYKSKASCTTFEGNLWRTRTATHYFSPEERK